MLANLQLMSSLAYQSKVKRTPTSNKEHDITASLSFSMVTIQDYLHTVDERVTKRANFPPQKKYPVGAPYRPVIHTRLKRKLCQAMSPNIHYNTKATDVSTNY